MIFCCKCSFATCIFVWKSQVNALTTEEKKKKKGLLSLGLMNLICQRDSFSRQRWRETMVPKYLPIKQLRIYLSHGCPQWLSHTSDKMTQLQLLLLKEWGAFWPITDLKAKPRMSAEVQRCVGAEYHCHLSLFRTDETSKPHPISLTVTSSYIWKLSGELLLE